MSKRVRIDNTNVNKQAERDRVVIEKQKVCNRVQAAFLFLVAALLCVSVVFNFLFSDELYHWMGNEPLRLGFTTSVSNTELKQWATEGRKASIVGYLAIGYADDLYLTSVPYGVPYYTGSNEMALYRNIRVDTTSMGVYEEGDLVRAEGLLVYDYFSTDVNGTTYNYRLKLSNVTFSDVMEDMGTYYAEYEKFQSSGGLACLSYVTTWLDYVTTCCYYQTYDTIEILNTDLLTLSRERLEGVVSEYSEAYLAAFSDIEDLVSRLNILIEAEDYAGIVDESEELYGKFDKFDNLLLQLDISRVV